MVIGQNCKQTMSHQQNEQTTKTTAKLIHMNSTCKMEAEHMSSKPRREHHSVFHGGPMF